MRKTFIIALLLAVCGLFPGVLSAKTAGILVEAESFTHKGGWVVDQQFMDIMGSPYLLAHGLGVPVTDASTQVTVPESGVYEVWVRTYNWVSPWTSGRGPGRFVVKIDGKVLPNELGAEGDEWMWQSAGKVRLKEGTVSLALGDLTGFDGRCDAVFLTKDRNCPPASVEELAAFRKEKLNLPDASVRQFDFVVAGGGIAGMCAAAAA